MPNTVDREAEPLYKRGRTYVPVQVTIPRPLLDQLARVAEEETDTRSGLVTQAVREFLARRASSAAHSPA